VPAGAKAGPALDAAGDVARVTDRSGRYGRREELKHREYEVEQNAIRHLKVRLNSSPSIPACLRMPFRVPFFRSRRNGTEKTCHPFCTATWDEVCCCGINPYRARYFTISSPETTGSLCYVNG